MIFAMSTGNFPRLVPPYFCTTQPGFGCTELVMMGESKDLISSKDDRSAQLKSR